VIHAEFVVSAMGARDFPSDGLPEVAFAGRSNVGKSSLINRLAKIRGLARTSSKPGKTQSINFYKYDRAFYLVDLPGFGYAKAGKELGRKWRILTEQYFRNRRSVSLVVQLVDARIPPAALDLQLTEWLQHWEIERLLVATKADKLSGNQLPVSARVIAEALGEDHVIMSSAITGMGSKEIWARVATAAQNCKRLKSL
jgi:GTP-binding protein